MLFQYMICSNIQMKARDIELFVLKGLRNIAILETDCSARRPPSCRRLHLHPVSRGILLRLDRCCHTRCIVMSFFGFKEYFVIRWVQGLAILEVGLAGYC